MLDSSSDADWWRARYHGLCQKTRQALTRFFRVKGKEGLVPSNLLETVSNSSSSSPLHDAAKRGNTALLRECLANKMPVNQTDPAGNTALHWAAKAGQLECLLDLLAVPQISINKTNKLGDTPALLAAQSARSQCLDALLQVSLLSRTSYPLR